MDSTIKLAQEIATKVKNFPCFQITVKQTMECFVFFQLSDHDGGHI